MKLTLRKLSNSRSLAVLFGIVTLFVISWFVYIRSDQTNITPSDPESSVVTYSTDNPSEEKPKDDFKWLGKSEEPKYIRLNTIQTEGYIQSVGVDQNKQVAVPNNIHLAGWFRDTVLPGKKGLSIIDGHVDGRTSAGIFKSLGNLKQDDQFTVEMGNGSSKTFKIKKVSTIDTSLANNELFSQDPLIKSQLNLITCGGTFDKQSKQYDKRVIAVSELVN